MSSQIERAAKVIKKGGVVAYPTEYCFGLGCDPLNESAVRRILKIKARSEKQGVILIAANTAQVEQFADLNAAPQLANIKASWPGAVTWILPARSDVPAFIKGEHPSVAMRVTDHKVAAALCHAVGSAIVSTSANRHAMPELCSAQAVTEELGSEVDFVVQAAVGGATRASEIRDGVSGANLR
ncbi:MAG: threonylcarbamoyl-AMP synthase [Gammaproteobacteria bacterium]|nr:threonylcarbamoyl-AMP synthase [Gammaproteobacteria bacterium]